MSDRLLMQLDMIRANDPEIQQIRERSAMKRSNPAIKRKADTLAARSSQEEEVMVLDLGGSDCEFEVESDIVTEDATSDMGLLPENDHPAENTAIEPMDKEDLNSTDDETDGSDVMI